VLPMHFSLLLALAGETSARAFSDWGWRVKQLLSVVPPQAIPVGHSLLFAVGAGSPQDGVRMAGSPLISSHRRTITST